MTAPVCFVDCETTGLDPDRHEIWEVGLIDALGDEHHWFLPVDESRADLIALNIGGYFDRHPDHVGDWTKMTPPEEVQEVCRSIQRITRGQHLAGAVVSFDADRLHRLLMANRVIPAWHYHLIDVEALAAGCIAGRPGAPDEGPYEPPWNSTELSRLLGVNPDQFDRHTALGDAQWARAIYQAVMGE